MIFWNPTQNICYDSREIWNILDIYIDDIYSYLDSDTISILPNHSNRLLLLWWVLYELHKANILKKWTLLSKEQAIKNSTILQILAYPYAPVFIDEVLQKIEEKNTNINISLISWHQSSLDGINSTLRNLFLCQVLNDTLLLESEFTCNITLAQYTWEEMKAKTSQGQMPSLPELTWKKLYLKFLISLESTITWHIIDYIDYGVGEWMEKYWISATWEWSWMIMWRPLGLTSFDPKNTNHLIRWLRQIEKSQDTKADRLSVKRMWIHLKMTQNITDYIDTSDGMSFPSTISDIEDLSVKQISQICFWSSMIKGMQKDINDEDNCPIAYPMKWMERKIIHIEMSQPSTRTLTAAQKWAEVLGFKTSVIQKWTSSKAKGENPSSEELTLSTHWVVAVMSRSGTFESDMKLRNNFIQNESTVSFDTLPVHISLGGNIHHPTQTLAEILLFIEDIGCDEYSIHQLQLKTQKNPPHIVFMGHTNSKRADKALIAFILQHLPHWKIQVIVPHEIYLPDLDIYNITKQSYNYTEKVIKNLTNEAYLIKTLTWVDYLYISNPHVTSWQQEKWKYDYKITKKILDTVHTKILAPLPASEELWEWVIDHPNSLINSQMENKFHIISSLLAHQISSREARKKK